MSPIGGQKTPAPYLHQSPNHQTALVLVLEELVVLLVVVPDDLAAGLVVHRDAREHQDQILATNVALQRGTEIGEGQRAESFALERSKGKFKWKV